VLVYFICKDKINIYIYISISILVGDTVVEIEFRAVASGGGTFVEGIALFAYYVCTLCLSFINN
jgi:hypothetical protein